ncbi:MAG: clostripain-related cysteine peptidase [Candidatus Cloacimonetes bacterium]|nr:clostripain-related cysteine peptidase [Candidatus Cloacimonadota bacterium]
MKLLFFIFFFPIFLLSTEWTLFFYMGADNDLHRHAIEDIMEMQKGLLSGNDFVNIIVYIDHAPSYKNGAVEYIQVRPSNSNVVDSRIIQTYPDENSGSGQTLTKFLNWAYPLYSSEKNILILWSHGSGWARGDMETRWIIEDSTSMSNIKVYDGELHDALARHNRKYDIIVLDACNSGSIEMVGELKNFTDLIIASPDLFPSRGFPWEQIIQSWESSYSSVQVSELFIANFIDAYSMGGVYNMFGISDIKVSIAVYDITKYDHLFYAIREFSDAFADSDYSDFFIPVRNTIHEYNSGGREIDLLRFMEAVNGQSSGNNANPSINEKKHIIENLYSAVDDFVIMKHSLFSFFHQSISIFYPRNFLNFIDNFYLYWHHLKFSNSDWGKFLNYVYGLDTHPPNQVTEINHVVNLETLYIDWEAPVDPTPLNYIVSIVQNDFLRTSPEQITLTNNQKNNTFSTKVYSSGYFTIEAIDEAGNHSEPTLRNFTFLPPHKDEFYIAPNPVMKNHSEFKIYYYLTKTSGFVNIEIYSISGQLVWEEKMGFHAEGEPTLPISVEPFSSGVYFGVMTTENSRLIDRFAIER